MSILLSLLASIGAKLLSSEALEYVLIWAAQILVDKTDNKYDDQLLAEVKKLLGRE